jgi:hypothetical protein
LHAAGFPDREAGLAFFLVVDYTIGFAVASTRTSVNEQRVRDAATRNQLHEFFRTLVGFRNPNVMRPYPSGCVPAGWWQDLGTQAGRGWLSCWLPLMAQVAGPPAPPLFQTAD